MFLTDFRGSISFGNQSYSLAAGWWLRWAGPTEQVQWVKRFWSFFLISRTLAKAGSFVVSKENIHDWNEHFLPLNLVPCYSKTWISSLCLSLSGPAVVKVAQNIVAAAWERHEFATWAVGWIKNWLDSCIQNHKANGSVSRWKAEAFSGQGTQVNLCSGRGGWLLFKARGCNVDIYICG